MLIKTIIRERIRQLLLFLFMLFLLTSLLLFIGSLQNFLIKTQLLLVNILDISGISYLLISIPYLVFLIAEKIRKKESDLHLVFRIVFCFIIVVLILFLFHFLASWHIPGV